MCFFIGDEKRVHRGGGGGAGTGLCGRLQTCPGIKLLRTLEGFSRAARIRLMAH